MSQSVSGPAVPSDRDAAVALSRHPADGLLSRYASNEASPRGKKIIAAHLEQCSQCRDAVGRLRDTARPIRDLGRLALTRFVFAQDSDRLPPRW